MALWMNSMWPLHQLHTLALVITPWPSLSQPLWWRQNGIWNMCYTPHSFISITCTASPSIPGRFCNDLCRRDWVGVCWEVWLATETWMCWISCFASAVVKCTCNTRELIPLGLHQQHQKSPGSRCWAKQAEVWGVVSCSWITCKWDGVFVF